MKADLHVHSIHSSDGKSTVAEIIKEAEARGLGAIGFTDHNSILGGQDALKITTKIIVVRGVEVTSSEGHILAYGVAVDIPSGRSAAETIKLIHEAGGIAVAAHPGRIWSGLKPDSILGNDFDAIEINNARSTPGLNRKARILAGTLKRPVTGGSDSHHFSTLGGAYAVVPDDCRTEADIIAAILAKRTGAEGSSRSASGTVRYGSKAIGQWVGRGMRRM
jgi:predicted metal-dependent phosphoesterase TrpH